MNEKKIIHEKVLEGMANKAHKDIPGNPSTATSSKIQLSSRENNEPLRVLSEEDWTFWKHNGYIVIKNAVPKDQVIVGVRRKRPEQPR